jgi:hypothetical protein
MAMAFDEPYIAGMWQRDLLEQLAWRVVKFRNPISDNRYRAPSWAWPAVDGVVKLPARLKHKRDFRMNIFPGRDGENLGVRLVLENAEEQFASLLFGSLTSETELHRLSFEARTPPKSTSTRHWSWQTGDGACQGAWCRFFPDTDFSFQDLNAAQDDMAAKMTNDFFLEEVLSEDEVPSKISRTTFTAAMLLYDGVFEGSYSGFALAVRPLRINDTQLFTRAGLVEFRNLPKAAWNALQAVRLPKPEDSGHKIAASDNRSDYSHIITIL